jgi:hypothetical protein
MLGVGLLSRRQLRSKYRRRLQMRCSGHVSSRRVQAVVQCSCRQPELRPVAGVQGINVTDLCILVGSAVHVHASGELIEAPPSSGTDLSESLPLQGKRYYLPRSVQFNSGRVRSGRLM